MAEPGPSGVQGTNPPPEVADRAILQAEKFQANITAPKGNEFLITNQRFESEGDDDFFHITCHVDSNLKDKIERGEFVDLEKLLPKERGSVSSIGDGNRMELVLKDGMTYFAPVQDKSSRITGLRKWEQAFRVYAAIYSQAQPHRASEIWQYVYVINLAANSYHWDNVAFYDYTFRQMMSQRPQRSWAETYVQGWNLAMTDPLGNKNNLTGGKSFTTGSQGGNNTKSWRDNCCWKYNKNKCHKPECNWDHRCTYCGGWNHGYYNCRKRLNKKSGNSHHGEHSKNGK